LFEMPVEQPFLGQNCVTPYPKSTVVMRGLWSLVQATLFRWSPKALHSFRARLLNLFGANIPRPAEVVIFPTVRVIFPRNLTLEPRSMVGPQVLLYNLGPITLRRGANISQRCHLCAGTHDYMRWDMPLVTKPIEIGENAWLGADVFVGPGVSIGKLCVIGARSVVVKSMPEYTVCAGNPCRPIKPRGEPQGS